MKNGFFMTVAAALGWTALAAPAPAYVDAQAKMSDDFVLTRDMSAKAACASAFRFEATDKALVVRFAAKQPALKGMKLDEADGVWKCPESFELFLDPSGAGKSLHHLVVAANGALLDVTTKMGRGAAPWTGDVTVAGSEWKAVLTVPWSALGVKTRPAVGDCWRFNVGRNFREEGGAVANATYARTGIGFKNPAEFENLFFGSPEAVAAALKERRRADSAELTARVGEMGLSAVFKDKLEAFAAGERASLLDEVRDELAVIEAIRKSGRKEK